MRLMTKARTHFSKMVGGKNDQVAHIEHHDRLHHLLSM